MIEPGVIELVPLRPRYLIVGWVGLTTHAVGLVALPFARRAVLSVVVFGILAVLGGALVFAAYRQALRRVVVPLPPGAIILPALFPTGHVAASVGITAVILASSVARNFGGSVLGVGFGTSLATLWAAHKITQFEGDDHDGRRILWKLGPRRSGRPGGSFRDPAPILLTGHHGQDPAPQPRTAMRYVKPGGVAVGNRARTCARQRVDAGSDQAESAEGRGGRPTHCC